MYICIYIYVHICIFCCFHLVRHSRRSDLILPCFFAITQGSCVLPSALEMFSNLNPRIQSVGSLSNQTWQKRPRERNSELRFYTEN